MRRSDTHHVRRPHDAGAGLLRSFCLALVPKLPQLEIASFNALILVFSWSQRSNNRLWFREVYVEKATSEGFLAPDDSAISSFNSNILSKYHLKVFTSNTLYASTFYSLITKKIRYNLDNW